MAPVETEYYDLLGVATDVDEIALKRAYRKQAMKYHPDKNPSADAEEKFKDISKAYHVLADPNLRAVYDKNGKAMVDTESGMHMEDAAGFFAHVFGGERFVDYIGEISLMKEMTNMASAVMTDEEKAEVERELNINAGWSANVQPGEQPASVAGEAPPTSATGPSSVPASPAPAHTPPLAEPTASVPTPDHAHAPATSPTTQPTPPLSQSGHQGQTTGEPASYAGPAKVLSVDTGDSGKDIKGDFGKKRRNTKLTAVQKQKLQEIEAQRRKAMEERVSFLTAKLIERLRPFVEAKRPGEKGDAETAAFEARMKREAEDLKLESFGVELLHAIGGVYMMKATSFMKSRKFLGIPGFFSRLREKGTLAKDAWGVLGSALSVQAMVMEMEKLQAKGEIGEQELKALEMDVTGKIMLASWRGTRFEVIQVLREVVDNVLAEKGVSDMILFNRAKGLLIMGAIFKSTEPEESDLERRELERMVAEAATGKSRRQMMYERAKAQAKARKDFLKEATQNALKEAQAGHATTHMAGHSAGAAPGPSTEKAAPRPKSPGCAKVDKSADRDLPVHGV